VTEENYWYSSLEPALEAKAAAEARIIVDAFRDREISIEIGGVRDHAEEDHDLHPGGIAYMYATDHILTRAQYLGGLGGIHESQPIRDARVRRGVLDVLETHGVGRVAVRPVIGDIVLVHLNPEREKGASGGNGESHGGNDETPGGEGGTAGGDQPDVLELLERIDDGALGKVVLARQIDVRANRPFVISDVLSRLLALYPTCMVFKVDGFLGASPELLIERRGPHVASHPLAGTIGRSGDLATDEALIAGLLASPKERREHAYVIDDLRATLGPLCESLDVPDKPTVLELRNVSHLATRLSGVLSGVGARPARRPAGPGPGWAGPGPSGRKPAHPGLGVPSALQLVAEVHPTPAVGGTPTDEAVSYIGEVEGFDRGRYAGPVGWMDARGDGNWAIGLRSAHVDGDRATMYAGVGIVAGSRPGIELEETQLKLQALLAALVRP